MKNLLVLFVVLSFFTFPDMPMIPAAEASCTGLTNCISAAGRRRNKKIRKCREAEDDIGTWGVQSCINDAWQEYYVNVLTCCDQYQDAANDPNCPASHNC